MAFSESLAGRVRDALAQTRGVDEKKMFGGIAFFLNGNILVGVRMHSLIVRLSPEQATEALREPYVTVFNAGGRPMKGWILVAPEGIEYDDQLKDWIARATQFVETLPAK